MSTPQSQLKMSRSSIRADAPNIGDQSSSDLKSAPSLWALLAQNVSWVAAAKGFSSGAAMLRTVLFARLLRPYDFGVFSAAWFWGVLIRLIIDPNFETALVAQDEDMHSYRHTVWTTMLFRSAVIAVLFIVAARPMAHFYKIPNEYRVFYAAGFLAFVMALKSPISTAMIERNLHFRISLLLNVGEMVSSIVFGLAAILYWNDWRGLVVSSYAGHIARGALTYWFFPYRPRINFDRQQARRLFRFGRWITLRRVAQYVARDLGNLTVGHLLGAQGLGEYQMALRLGEPAAEIGETASMVSFPLAARYRSDPNAVTRLLVLGSIAVLIPGLLYAGLVMYGGAELISLTAGPKWLGAVIPFKTLCLYGLFSGLLTVGRSVLDGLNRPHESFWISIANAGILTVAIYPMTIRWGTNGAAIAVSGAAAMTIPLLYWLYARARSDRNSGIGGNFAEGK